MSCANIQVEIATQGPADARKAQLAGADRVELCAALAQTGGLTPSLPTIERTVAVGIPVHVLIRSYAGGFRYDSQQIDLMCAEIEMAVRAGAAGVVVGAAKIDPEHPDFNLLDLGALTQFKQAAGQVEVTLHRVCDTVKDLPRALNEIQQLGYSRVLTSAGQVTAPQAAEKLASLVQSTPAQSGLQIMAGGGIRPDNVDVLLSCGLAAIHASCSSSTDKSGPSGPGGGNDFTTECDQKTIIELIRKVHS